MARSSTLPAPLAADAPVITVEQITTGGPRSLSPRETMFVAHGPGGFVWMLKRYTAEAARRDGLAYFLAHHVQDEHGTWWGSDEHGKPHHDSNGNPHPSRATAVAS